MAKRILTVIVAVLAALIVAVGAYVAYVVLTYDRLEDNLPLTPEAPLNEAASTPGALDRKSVV